MKLINNLRKKFLRLEKTRATVTLTSIPISEICQFGINNRLGYFDQLTIVIKIIQTIYDGKINETNEKIVKA